MSQSQKNSKIVSSVLLVLGAGLLLLSQSAYWVNHSVFNKENFTTTTTTALMSEASRTAIATEIVDRTLEDYPRVQRTIGSRAIALTSGLLGSDLSNQAVQLLSGKVYAYTTAANRQDIKVDLTGVKEPLSKLVTLAQNNDRAQNISVDQIPDEIVLLEKTTFPDMSGLVKTMLWLSPLLWLSTLIVFGSYIYIGRQNYAKRVYAVGAVIAGVSIIGLATGPFIPPSLAAAVPNIELRPVVESLATGFLAPFKTQMYYMLLTATALLLVFSQRFRLLSLVSLIDKKTSKR